jgi:hypothetical protein
MSYFEVSQLLLGHTQTTIAKSFNLDGSFADELEHSKLQEQKDVRAKRYKSQGSKG